MPSNAEIAERAARERFYAACKSIRNQLAKLDLARKLNDWVDFADGIDETERAIEESQHSTSSGSEASTEHAATSSGNSVKREDMPHQRGNTSRFTHEESQVQQEPPQMDGHWFVTQRIIKKAVQWNGNNEYEIADFMPAEKFTISDSGAKLFIETLQGCMEANVLDWIIRGVNGEFYPCKPDIFAKTYEPFRGGGDDTRELRELLDGALRNGDWERVKQARRVLA